MEASGTPMNFVPLSERQVWKIRTALKNAVSNGSVQIERGKVQLVDRERLEAQACTCYGIIRRSFERAAGEL